MVFKSEFNKSLRVSWNFTLNFHRSQIAGKLIRTNKKRNREH